MQIVLVQKGGFGQKAVFSSTKIGRQNRVEGAMPSQLLVHFKKLIWPSFRINLVPKIMVQFCYVTVYLGTETVSCRFCCY